MTLQILIDGTPRNVPPQTLSIEDTAEERTTAEFALDDDDSTVEIRQGTPVEIYDDEVLEFAGVVEVATAAPELPSTARRWTVVVKDWHHRADRRILAGSYENQTCGAIVLGDIATLLAEEDITVSEDNVDDGPVVTLAQFAYVPISRALDALAERAGFSWWIDPDKTLHFRAPGSVAAPWAVTWDDIDDDHPTLAHQNPSYRNRQYIRGGRAKTDSLTERLLGDGETRSFLTSFPVAESPTIIEHRWEQGLVLDGASYASAPDATQLDITGDITLVVYAQLDSWATDQYILSKLGAVGQRSYVMRVHGSGKIELDWSADGSALTGALSTVAVPFSAGEYGAIAASLDVNDGAGNRVIKFYTSPDGITWSQLGSTVTASGTTSIFASTAKLHVGESESGVGATTGTIYEARVYSGLHDPVAGSGGTLVAAPTFGDPAAWPPGSGVVTDPVGNIWSVQRSARVAGELAEQAPSTVGIGGVDTGTPRDWNWNVEQNTIFQDPDGDTLGILDELEVGYVGSFPIVAIGTDDAEQYRVIDVEGGGSGLVEDVEDGIRVESNTEAFELISAKLGKYARAGSVLRFMTRRAGLRPGQLATVTLPELGLSEASMWISHVTTSGERGGVLRRDVQAVSGPNLGSPTRFFESLIRRGDPVVIRENISEQEILVVLTETDEGLEISESVDVTPITCALLSSSTVFPFTLC